MEWKVWVFTISLHNFLCYGQQFEFSDLNRVKQGKEIYEQFDKGQKYQNSKCWRSALTLVDTSCRKMSDIHQSYLALQFANCHLEKSGLQTYTCTLQNFRDCTNQMSPIAFNTYTQFFSHVSDICFYFQSEIWRDKTEETIGKLSQTSEESLSVLSKSVQQQKEVISAQEKSLKNQKDIIKNENILKETLLSSAQSAKDVFQEVRDQAQQQKTMFSETFDNIIQSVEKLANLQKMLLGEFIGLQSVAFYIVATIVCYLFTSTPQTSGARLFLFGCLSILIVTERICVGRTVNSEDQQLTASIIHERIWVLRKIFLAIGTIILGIFIIRYKDFNKINFCMLQDIQTQIIELRKIQQSQTIGVDQTDNGSLDATIVPATESENHLEEAAKKLELNIQSFVTSTPHKANLEKMIIDGKTKKLAEFSDDEIVCDETVLEAKKERRKSRNRIQLNETTFNESNYNLRKRRSNGINTTIKDRKSKVSRNKKTGNKDKTKPAFFSSDDEF